MRAIVNAERCQGHLRCVAIAPELFVEDDLGHGEAAHAGDVSPELERAVRLAAANCPESAIEITESVS